MALEIDSPLVYNRTVNTATFKKSKKPTRQDKTKLKTPLLSIYINYM